MASVCDSPLPCCFHFLRSGFLVEQTHRNTERPTLTPLPPPQRSVIRRVSLATTRLIAVTFCVFKFGLSLRCCQV